MIKDCKICGEPVLDLAVQEVLKSCIVVCKDCWYPLVDHPDQTPGGKNPINSSELPDFLKDLLAGGFGKH